MIQLTDPAHRPAPRRGRRLLVVVGGLVVAVMATAGPVAAADPPRPREPSATVAPSPTGTPTPVAAASTTRRSRPTATLPAIHVAPTRMLIHRTSAMVKQYTNYWCVPAAAQTMLNLILGTSDRTRATQERYYAGTRKNNRYTYATKGNDPEGWAWSLRYYSGGVTNYQARSFTSKDAALDAIVDSIARTGTPVGVPVHDGTHAWVVLGYKTEPDPASPTRRKILGFYVNGPLGSPKDPWTYEYMSTAAFKSHFTRYHEWQRDVVWEGTWVIIAQ